MAVQNLGNFGNLISTISIQFNMAAPLPKNLGCLFYWKFASK